MSWRVTPNQRGTRRPGRGGMRFLNPGGWTCKRGGIQAPTPPSGARDVGALGPRSFPPSPASPSTQRPGARGADYSLAWGPPNLGKVDSAWHPPPKLPAPSKKCEHRPSPLVSQCTFPTDARSEALRGAALGDRVHKSPARSPCSSPSFSILPRSQVELGGLKQRVNEASVQNDSFLNQTACSVLGKWDAHLNLIHPPPAATAMYLPT